MTIKGSIEYMGYSDYLALYQQAKVCRSGSIKEQAESKRIAARSKSYMLLMTSAQAVEFFKRYPTLWKADNENGIGWTSTANVTQVFAAAEKLNIKVLPLYIDHKDIPLDANHTRAEWLEKKACELMTMMIGEKFNWTGKQNRGAHGAYRPDGMTASGLKLEVKGASSVMTCSSAEKVHNK